jgi:hypothetical protein
VAGPAAAASLRRASPTRPRSPDLGGAADAPGRLSIPVTSGNEKAVFEPPGCSRLLRSMADLGETRRRHVTRRFFAHLAPPERGGEIPRVGPTLAVILRIQRGPVAHPPKSDPVERPGAHGFDPGSDSYRDPARFSARAPREHTPPVLFQEQAQGKPSNQTSVFDEVPTVIFQTQQPIDFLFFWKSCIAFKWHCLLCIVSKALK